MIKKLYTKAKSGIVSAYSWTKDKVKKAWDWTKRKWKEILVVAGIGIALAAAPAVLYPPEYVTAPENNTYKIGVLNYDAVLSEDISSERPLQYVLDDKFLSMKPAMIKVDGREIKALQPSSAVINPKNYYYSGVFGEGIDLDMNFGERVWNKVVKLDRADRLGALATKAKTVELWFEFETNFVIDGWNKRDYFEITDTVRVGDYSYLEPAFVWDSYSEEVCETVSFDDYCDPDCTQEDEIATGCDYCDPPQEVCETIDHRQKIKSYLTRDGGKLYYVKEIPVEWLKTAVFPIYTDADITYGAASTFNSATTEWINVEKLDTNNLAICYKETSKAGQCIAGTVSGTSFTWGDEVVVDSDISVGDSRLGTCELDTNKFMVVYTDDSAADDGFVVAGSVATRVISLGGALEFADTDVESEDCAQYDTDKAVITYNDETDGDDFWYNTISASGTTLTDETAAEIAASNYFYSRMAKANTDVVVFCYVYYDTSDHGFCRAGTLSGTTMTTGSAVNYDTATIYYGGGQKCGSLGNDSYFGVAWIAMTDGDQNVRLGSISGTSISFGASQIVDDNADWAGIGGPSAITYIDSTHVVVSYADGGDSSKGKSNYITISGTSVSSLGTEETFEDGDINYSSNSHGLDSVLVDTNKIAICFTDNSDSNSNYGKCIIGDIGAAPPAARRIIITQ